MFDAQSLKGMTSSAAEDLAKANGYTVRVEMEDDNMLLTTCDWNLRRINVGIVGDLITSVHDFG